LAAEAAMKQAEGAGKAAQSLVDKVYLKQNIKIKSIK